MYNCPKHIPYLYSTFSNSVKLILSLVFVIDSIFNEYSGSDFMAFLAMTS